MDHRPLHDGASLEVVAVVRVHENFLGGGLEDLLGFEGMERKVGSGLSPPRVLRISMPRKMHKKRGGFVRIQMRCCEGMMLRNLAHWDTK